MSSREKIAMRVWQGRDVFSLATSQQLGRARAAVFYFWILACPGIYCAVRLGHRVRASPALVMGSAQRGRGIGFLSPACLGSRAGCYEVSCGEISCAQATRCTERAGCAVRMDRVTPCTWRIEQRAQTSWHSGLFGNWGEGCFGSASSGACSPCAEGRSSSVCRK